MWQFLDGVYFTLGITNMHTPQRHAFLKDEIFSNVLMATTQRGNVYVPDADEDEKITFRCNLRSELLKFMDQYKSTISEQQHFSNIQDLSGTISGKHPSLLLAGKFRIGSAQKALNLWLKYLWCIDWLPIPPHCPFDAVVLSRVSGCENIRWTKLDSIQEYKEIVRLAKVTAGQEPLAIWELNLYNIYAQPIIPGDAPHKSASRP